MALVDYESSGEESEGEINEIKVAEENKVLHNNSRSTINISCKNSNNDVNSNESIFSSLPTPIANVSFLADDNKLNNLLLNKSNNIKKQKESVKISVPSVSEFDESDQPATKKRKPSTKGVGLFSVLPPPKNSFSKESIKTFVPHSIKKTLSKPNSRVNVKIDTPKSTPPANESDDEDEALVGSSFFGSSLTTSPIKDETVSEKNMAVENINEQKIEYINEPSNRIAPNPEQNISNEALSVEEETSNLSGENSQSGNEAVLEEDNPLALDEKALQILCGNKKKRKQMSMNIIDLSGEEIMPNSKEWLLKQLSQEKRGKSHSHRKHDGPSSQSRRKHQITYLAFQAKEQELELQNQWANNRMSRRQTQSKYGF